MLFISTLSQNLFPLLLIDIHLNIPVGLLLYSGFCSIIMKIRTLSSHKDKGILKIVREKILYKKVTNNFILYKSPIIFMELSISEDLYGFGEFCKNMYIDDIIFNSISFTRV
jgi:hypothetical protein